MEEVTKQHVVCDSTDEVLQEHAVALMLVENHARFLAFVRRRVGVPEVAEDILQAAYVKALQCGGTVRPGNALPWFYRVLHNSMIDYYRRSAVADRTVQMEEAAEVIVAKSPDLPNVCPCVSQELTCLRADYASALTEVDMATTKVQDYARRTGINSNNASVRLYRARKALRNRLEKVCGPCAGAGCFDCTCA